MSIQYSCFISYRHGQRRLAERIISDLYDALSSELELLRNEEVYLDRERLQGGDFYNEALASALCQSACMVVVFTPTYFDKEHPFCAREYRAMEQLEETRLSLLNAPSDKRRGLIIPIVFRGVERLPKEIKDQRQYYDFSNFLMSDAEMGQHPGYAPKIREIAAYIAERCTIMAQLTPDSMGSCEQFALPSELEVQQWLEQVTGSAMPFPGR